MGQIARTVLAMNERRGWIEGAIATSVVGASFPVSHALTDAPFAFGQAVRYLLGAAILAVLLRGRLVRPTLRELAVLAAIAAVGMVGFNLLLLAAVERIGGANTSVVVGLSPLLLALTAATPRLLASAAVVVAGAALATGTSGEASAIGLALAAGVLLCEVGFTLLAAPLLGRLGPMSLSTWACLLACLQLTVLGAVTETPALPTLREAAALLYLAVATTALAFVLWFGAVQRLGSGRAGLLVGLMPVAALVVEAALEQALPTAPQAVGVMLVGAGVAYGARRREELAPDVPRAAVASP